MGPAMNCCTRRVCKRGTNDRCVTSSIALSGTRSTIGGQVNISMIHSKGAKSVVIGLIGLLPMTIGTRIRLPSLRKVGAATMGAILTKGPASRRIHPMSNAVRMDRGFKCRLPTCSFAMVQVGGGRGWW